VQPQGWSSAQAGFWGISEMALSDYALQRKLNAAAAAAARAHKLQSEICAHCLEVWGQEPGDVDFDTYIDLVAGGCGQASGMDVEDFKAGMDRLCGGSDEER